MNLVAKEFVAAQDPADPGALVLSCFAGAAQQLDGALLINPHDAEAMADALDRALLMPLAERRARWQSMWAAIAPRSPVVWGRAFVAALLRATAINAVPDRPLRGGLLGEPARQRVIGGELVLVDPRRALPLPERMKLN